MKRLLKLCGVGVALSAGGFVLGNSLSNNAPVAKMASAESSAMCTPVADANSDQIYFVGCGGFF